MSNESRKQRLMREALGGEGERPAIWVETLARAALILAVVAVAGLSAGDFGSGDAEALASATIQGN